MPKQKKPRGNCLSCGRTLTRLSKRYCDNQCQNDHEYSEYIRRWLVGEEDGNRGGYHISYYVRRYMIDLASHRCQKCGWCEINPYTHKMPLTISHINGNWRDSRRVNLEVLCPNCHSLTETYCALNKGNGRPRYK
jgi:hypothetical protein